jgi:hypothetical protein
MTNSKVTCPHGKGIASTQLGAERDREGDDDGVGVLRDERSPEATDISLQ